MPVIVRGRGNRSAAWIVSDAGMRFSEAIDSYLVDMELQGRLTTPESAKKYRSNLEAHCRDVRNRDPARVGREDIKETLRRWPNPNTRGYNRSILVSFYDWVVEEGIRDDSPVRKIRPPRRKPPVRPRITEIEAVRMLWTARGTRERRAIFLGLCTGLRNAELRGLQGRHFQREDFVWVSCDIAKGGRERFVPVMTDLVPVIAEIRDSVRYREYVLPRRGFHPPLRKEQMDRIDLGLYQSSTQGLKQLVARVAQRAAVVVPVTPHMLRYAFADRMARAVDARIVQHLLGHARLSSTERYLGQPRLDELANAVRGVSYRSDGLAYASMPADPTDPGAMAAGSVLLTAEQVRQFNLVAAAHAGVVRLDQLDEGWVRVALIGPQGDAVGEDSLLAPR